MMNFEWTKVGAVSGLLCAASVLVVQASGLQEGTPEDHANIAGQRERFLSAWVEGDADTVLDCLEDEAVLIPHRGALPVLGKEKIRSFWFPPDSPSTIYEFAMKPSADIEIEGAIAYEYGRYTLAFDSPGDVEVTRNEGNYVSIWRKGEDGQWRFALRTWNHY